MSEDLKGKLVNGFAQALGIPLGRELDLYVTEGHGRLPGPAQLLAWDANSVHGVVFDTTNATAIRGASELLKKLDDDLHEGQILNLSRSQILFAGGGSGLAVVSKVQARTAIALLHDLFAERTLVGTCSAVAVDLGSGDLPFNEVYVACQDELARERVRRGSDAEPAVPFFALRCEVCGRRAAAVVADKRIGGSRPECDVCFHTIEHGKKSRYGAREVTDFKEIADKVRGGFLAVVYLDGNGIGRRISMLPSPLAYATFSRAIKQLVRNSFDELTRRYGLQEEGKAADDWTFRGHAFQLPICGGDDLVATLPADIAVPFTRDLLRRLEEEADRGPELRHPNFSSLDPIGAAAGVAIGKVGFPIRHLIQEAEALLETAKERCYGPGNVRSALDFAEIGDGSPRRESVKPDRLRKEIPEMLSTGRPYSLPELQVFSSRFRAVRRAAIGQSQLYNLRRYADAGPAQLRNHTLYQIGRRDDWRALIGDLAGDPGAVRDKERAIRQVVPDYVGHPVFDLGDMLELLDHWREDKEASSP
jgi:hypothetical protein